MWHGSEAEEDYRESLNQIKCAKEQKEQLFCIGNPHFCAKMDEYKLKGKPNDGLLCQLFNGSDKCLVHKYADVYDFLFRDLRQEIRHMLEIGIGSKSPKFRFTSAPRWVIGASQRAWRNYFPSSRIYAADIDREVLFEEERIKSYHVDISKNDTLHALIEKIGTKLDILVDDSLHTLEGQENLISVAYDWIKPGGYYIVEDVPVKTICAHSLPSLLKRGVKDFAFVQTELVRFDSVLQVIRKPYSL